MKSLLTQLVLCAAVLSVTGQRNITIDVCTNQTGRFEYHIERAEARSVEYQWTFIEVNCRSDHTALLLEAESMTITNWLGKLIAFVAISGDKDISNLEKGSCLLLLPSNASTVNISVTKGCESLTHIWMNEVFPQTVKFTKKPSTAVTISFRMKYTYLASEDRPECPTTIASTFGTFTASTGALKTTDRMDERPTYTTNIRTSDSRTTTSHERETGYTPLGNNQGTSCSSGVTSPDAKVYIIIIAVLSALLVATIITLATLLTRHAHCKKTNTEEDVTESSEKTSQPSEPIYTDVKKPKKCQQASEREIVVNELYEMSP